MVRQARQAVGGSRLGDTYAPYVIRAALWGWMTSDAIHGFRGTRMSEYGEVTCLPPLGCREL